MHAKTNLSIQSLALFLLSTLLCGSALADVLTWDGDTDYANGINNANGNWNDASVWRPSSGSANVTWNSAAPDDAILGGTTGGATTIALDAATGVGSLTYAKYLHADVHNHRHRCQSADRRSGTDQNQRHGRP